MSETSVKNTQKPKLQIKSKYSFWPLLFDYGIRWILLIVLTIDLLPENYFWIAQLLFVPIGVFAYAANDEVKKKQAYKTINNIPEEENISLLPSDTIWSILFLIFVVMTGSIISALLFDSIWIRILVGASTFIGYGFYSILIYTTSHRSPEEEVSQELTQIQPTSVKADINDEQIVAIETSTISITERVETYTLESTLFGALVFAGFLGLISMDRPIFTYINTFMDTFSSLLANIANANLSTVSSTLTEIFGDPNLVTALITIETLINSLFFLLVIIYRVRFSDALKNVQHASNVARHYNDKEEEIHIFILQREEDITETIQNRLEYLQARIDEQCVRAEKALNELTPIVFYMQTFRNIGVATFVLIIITSSILISNALTLAFTGLVLFAYLYSSIERRIRKRSSDFKEIEIGLVQLIRHLIGQVKR